MGSSTELIKGKLDVVDFLRGYLNLQPAGKNFKALCPFHKEKTPSFMISPDRQSWHCFGCGIGGDIFGFIMRYENVEFGEALRILAEKAGVELRRLDPAEHKYTGLLYELNDRAKDFFRKALTSFPGGKKYLAERGLKPETIEEFELGWAPNESEALSMHLLNSGYAPDDILRAGLAIKNDRSLLLDRFRGRIMFPIHNHFGRVVGFTGRVLPHEGPEFVEGTQNTLNPSGFVAAKYVNSPETPIFNKSHLLYGFFKSKNSIRDAASAFLVEGQMDFLMSWQAGVKNVIASSGTALTSDHLRTLRRLTDEIVLSFDNDDAGSAASERAIDLAEANDFSVRVVVFDKFKDPAEAAAADPDGLAKSISAALPAPKFYFEKYLPKAGSLDYGRREGLRSLRLVLGKVKNIASPVQRNFWLNELAKRTGVQEKILTEEMERIVTVTHQGNGTTAENAGNGEDSSSPTVYSRRELIGERLLRAAVAKNNFGFIDDSAPFLATSQQEILGLLKSGTRSSRDKNLDDILNFIILGSEEIPEDEVGRLKQELLKEHYKEKKQSLVTAIRRAEEAGDEAKLRLALEELNNIPTAVFES